MLPVTSLLGQTLSIFHFKKSNIIFLLIHSYQFWGSPWDHTDWIAICLTKIYNINKKWNDLLKINLRPHTGPCFSCSFIWTINISLYLHAMSSLRLWTLSISQWEKKKNSPKQMVQRFRSDGLNGYALSHMPSNALPGFRNKHHLYISNPTPEI